MSEPSHVRPPRRSDAHRNRKLILARAATTLAENPAATLEQVIAGTGLGRTTVYRHFPSRATLIEALIAQGMEAARDLLARARPTEGPFGAALERTIHATLAAGTQIREILALSDRSVAATLAPATQIETSIRCLMRLGVHEGALRADLPLDWHVELYFALATAALQTPAGTDTERAIRDALLNGLGRT